MARDAPDIRRFFAPPARPPVSPAASPARAAAAPPPPPCAPSSDNLPRAPPATTRTFAKRKKPDKGGDRGQAPVPDPERARPPPPPPPPRRVVQTHLDLGQATFHSTTCPDCGLLYAPGDPADEALHRAHHAAATLGPRVTAGGGVRVVATVGDASRPAGPGRALPTPSSSGRILHAPPGRRPAAVAAAVARAEAALSSAPGWADPKAGKSAHVLLFEAASDRRVAGVAVVEPLPRGGKLTRWQSDPPSPPHPRPAAGVRAVWVAPSHRRVGVASALLDAGRDVVAPLARIPRGALAFSAPTEEGAALAAAYTGEAGFAVYECVE